MVLPHAAWTAFEDGTLPVYAAEAIPPAVDVRALQAGGRGAREEDGSRKWTCATRWIDLELNVGFILMATRFMESIWDVARARYCKQLPERGINFYDKQAFFDDMFLGMETLALTTMHMPLLYYADRPPDEPPSDSSSS